MRPMLPNMMHKDPRTEAGRVSAAPGDETRPDNDGRQTDRVAEVYCLKCTTCQPTCGKDQIGRRVSTFARRLAVMISACYPCCQCYQWP